MINEPKDLVLEEVNRIASENREKALPLAKEIADLIYKRLEEDETLEIKHAFLSLASANLFVSQSICKDADEYNDEISQAERLAVDKIANSLMPLMRDGQVVEENFDINDLKTGRVVMALALAVDYITWKTEFGQYAKKREELEAELATQITEEN